MEGVKQTVEVSADGLILWCEMQEAERHGRPQDAIAREPILVYSKSYCPHSQRAKRILQGLPDELGPGADMPPTTVVELDQLGQLGANMQAYLAQLTGQRTVPNQIFIHQKHVGGADDLSRLHTTGVLRDLVLASSFAGSYSLLPSLLVSSSPSQVFPGDAQLSHGDSFLGVILSRWNWVPSQDAFHSCGPSETEALAILLLNMKGEMKIEKSL
ncbi:hypothetical protein VP01_158g1 [Puccinia sorghi]|uniref:Glutaredoxin domain-containing protein n=1 Tax=Puccinia sorghi TaxID=27349 RepID=A0A0L6VI26_9BASI|nr:hypothetical protein VP01_158g1 [Puccinia sorghi]